MLNELIRIVVAEDDDVVFTGLKEAFKKQGCTIIRADKHLGPNTEFSDVDLLILDVDFSSLSNVSKIDFIRSHCQIPIVTLDSTHNRKRKIAALEAGADDHFFKPLDYKEVVARVGALLRRITHAANSIDFSAIYGSRKPCGNRIFFDNWVVNPVKYEVISKNGEPCSLTTGDFALLMLFLKNAHTVLSRDQIMNALHGHEWSPYDRSIDNHVSRLRRKIEVDPNNPKIIKTVRGIGYTLVADVEKVAIPQDQLFDREMLIG